MDPLVGGVAAYRRVLGKDATALAARLTDRMHAVILDFTRSHGFENRRSARQADSFESDGTPNRVGKPGELPIRVGNSSLRP